MSTSCLNVVLSSVTLNVIMFSHRRLILLPFLRCCLSIVDSINTIVILDCAVYSSSKVIFRFLSICCRFFQVVTMSFFGCCRFYVNAFHLLLFIVILLCIVVFDILAFSEINVIFMFSFSSNVVFSGALGLGFVSSFFWWGCKH